MKNLRQASGTRHQAPGKIFSLALAAALLLPAIAPVAHAAPGTTSAELLKIPIGARAVGMGEAYTAMVDDSSSLEWNPAGMAEAQQKQASFMHSSLIENVNYEHLSYINPGTSYAAGASMSYLGYGSIAGYDNNGTSIGDQSAYSYIFNGGLATKFYERWSGGLTAALVHEKLASDSATTMSLNAGTIYDVLATPFQTNYRFGFSMLNLGPGLKFVSERDPLPRQFKFGAAALRVHQLPLNLSLDLGVPNDNSVYASFGSEYWFRDLLALRLGYTGANTVSNGFRFGFGLKIREILFDYAYGSFGDFGATHRIELALHFGEPTHQMNKEERAILKDAKNNLKEGNDVAAILTLNQLLDKDPENPKVLKQMIEVHEAMLKKQLNEQEAATASDKNGGIPSPEEFALQDLVPGQQAVASANPAALPPVNPGDDPLNLEALPDANNLNTAEMLSHGPALPAAQPNPPQTIEAPLAKEKPAKASVGAAAVGGAAASDQAPIVDAPLAKEKTNNFDFPSAQYPPAKSVDVGEKVTPTMAPSNNGPAAGSSGVAPTPAPTQDNSATGDNTLINPSDIYGNQ